MYELILNKKIEDATERYSELMSLLSKVKFVKGENPDRILDLVSESYKNEVKFIRKYYKRINEDAIDIDVPNFMKR